MLSVLEIIGKTTDYLAGKGIESPRLNAELLIGCALGLPRMQLYLQFERLLTEVELGLVRPLVWRRGQHEPIQYILGETEFFGLRLKVDPRALIPRPETEQLIEQIVGALGEAPTQVLDLGTGSGAMALALAKVFPHAAVTATDRSADALALARENAAATGYAGRITFVVSDWFADIPAQRFDLIAANPPYLSTRELAETAPEVQGFEPSAALVAADAGAADLRQIISSAPGFLATGGMLALETGISHHGLLGEALQVAGFHLVESRRDLAGRDRFLLARI